MNYGGQNLNRVHAVKQLSKGLKREGLEKDGEFEVLSSIANAIIYVGDELHNLNKTFKLEDTQLKEAV